MNIQLGIALLAAGALAELILLRHPTPGERIGAVVKIFGAAGIGTFFVPVQLAGPFLVGYVLAKVGDVLAEGLAWVVEKFRIWRDDHANPL